MSIERIIRCDGPDCEVHQHTLKADPYVPVGWIRATEGSEEQPNGPWHFCTWNCGMKFAAQVPPPEETTWDEISDKWGGGDG